jgi:glycosyltransferase involved in cell wall biosynthesis
MYQILTSFKDDADCVHHYIRGLLSISPEEKRGCNRIILVDDGSSDGTCLKLDALTRAFHVELIPGVDNRVWIHENFNLALQKFPDTDYLLRLDADIELESGYVTSCLDYMQENPECYSVGGIVQDMASMKWVRKASLIPTTPWGGARFYAMSRLRKIGGFHGMVWQTPLGVVHDEDEATDKVARAHGFKVAVVDSVTARHWRPLSKAAVYAANRRSGVLIHSLKHHDFRATLDALLLPSSVFWKGI